MATINRKAIRGRIHRRIRRKVSGTAERPRLSVYFSGKHVYAQVIDDDAGRTLVSAATTEKSPLAQVACWRFLMAARSGGTNDFEDGSLSVAAGTEDSLAERPAG